MLPNLPQTMIAFWGVVKCGAVAVMVNPLYMERELLQNLNDAGAECLVLLDMLWPRVAPLRDRLPVKTYVVTGIADALSFPLNLIYRFTKGRQKAVPIPYDDKVIAWKDFSRGAQPLSEPIADPQNTPALLQYTGGTTGIPKGVALTHSNLGTNCRQILSIIQETPETEHRFVGLLPFFHVYGLTTGLTIPAALAATVLPLPRYVPQDVLHLIGKHRPTVFPGAPAVYSSLLQQKTLGQYDLTCIKLCISGSAPLPRDTFRRFQELTGAIILEGYGLTEASPITHINPREDSKQKEGSIGMPLPGTDARIVDSESGTAPCLWASWGNWSSVARRSCRATGTCPTRPPAPCATAGSIPATWPSWTRKAISSSWTARRTWSSWAATTSIRVKWTKSCWNTPTCWKA